MRVYFPKLSRRLFIGKIKDFFVNFFKGFIKNLSTIIGIITGLVLSVLIQYLYVGNEKKHAKFYQVISDY